MIVLPTRSIRRGIKYAHKAALASMAQHYRVGAAIFKGPRLISIGWNSEKTHPSSCTRYSAHHAEFSALVGNYKYDLVGASIFVVRITPSGKIGMAKPCDACQDFIYAAGITKVFYTNFNGNIEKL